MYSIPKTFSTVLLLSMLHISYLPAQQVGNPKVAKEAVIKSDSVKNQKEINDSIQNQLPPHSQSGLSGNTMPPPELVANETTPIPTINETLPKYALVLFALAAAVGAYLLSLVLRNIKRPLFIAAVHGLFALTGLGLLFYFFTQHSTPLVALIVFGVAALGGAIMFLLEITNKPVPKWLAIVHGMAALTGVALLVYFIIA